MLVPFGGPDLGLALNMVVNLRALSYDHVLLLGGSAHACRQAVFAIPDVGEGFDGPTLKLLESCRLAV